jgi:hypothetical protein
MSSSVSRSCSYNTIVVISGAFLNFLFHNHSVNTRPEGKSAPVAVITRWASPSGRSAQIRGVVIVHQESLIH